MMLGFFVAMALINSAHGQIEQPQMHCAGGAYIVFVQGSADLDATAQERLRQLAVWSRPFRSMARLRVESEGDGEGAAFDRDLSRRRSNAIRSFLIREGYQPDQLVIGIRGADPNHRIGVNEAEPELNRLGWVGQLLPSREYARHFPNRNLECF
jgi:hypothetical protein